MFSRILVWLSFITVFLIGVVFAVYNPHLVTLNYVLGNMEIRLAVLLLISLIIGTMLGGLFTLSWGLKLRYQNRRLRKLQQQLKT